MQNSLVGIAVAACSRPLSAFRSLVTFPKEKTE